MSIIILFTFVCCCFVGFGFFFSFSSPSIASHSLHFIERKEIFLPFRFFFYISIHLLIRYLSYVSRIMEKLAKQAESKKLHIFHFISNERKEKNTHERTPAFTISTPAKLTSSSSEDIQSSFSLSFGGEEMLCETEIINHVDSIPIPHFSSHLVLFTVCFFSRPFFHPSLFSLSLCCLLCFSAFFHLLFLPSFQSPAPIWVMPRRSLLCVFMFGTTTMMIRIFFYSLLFSFHRNVLLLNKICWRHEGFVIIPKKVDQNQTRIIDREKSSTVTSSVPVGNYSVPNSISDTNKNSRSSIKNSMISNSNSKMTPQKGSQLATSQPSSSSSVVTNNSSNQLGEHANDTQLLTTFSTTNYTNITAQVGAIVELPCTVHHLTEGTMVGVILVVNC